MNILQVYEQYGTMNNLREHQMRVAAVAKMICDHFDGDLHADNIVSACLLHDMGNIIKADLTHFPEFLEPQGFAYWQEVQKRMRAQYGEDEHTAIYAIARDLGVSDRTQQYIENMGSSKAAARLADTEFEMKICCYADMRVGPYGIVSLEERITDLIARYPHKNHPERRKSLLPLEQEIFARCSIRPEDITDDTVDILALEMFSVR